MPFTSSRPDRSTLWRGLEGIASVDEGPSLINVPTSQSTGFVCDPCFVVGANQEPLDGWIFRLPCRKKRTKSNTGTERYVEIVEWSTGSHSLY